MRSSTTALDRALVALVGAALVLGGLVVLDWRAGLVLDLPDRLDTAGALRLVDRGWWPWVAAAGGVVLALLALWWLLAHLPRRGPATARLHGSDPTGTLRVDLRSVAEAVAGQLEQLGAVDSSHSSTTRDRGRDLLVVRARLAERADLGELTAAVTARRAEVDEAFGGAVSLRVLLEAPRSGRRRGRHHDDQGSDR